MAKPAQLHLLHIGQEPGFFFKNTLTGWIVFLSFQSFLCYIGLSSCLFIVLLIINSKDFLHHFTHVKVSM